MQELREAETQRFSHYWGGWKMSPWVYFLTWRLTSPQWWRKGCHHPMTQCSGLRFQAAQARWVRRPGTASLTAPAQCFSGGYIPSAPLMASATRQVLLGEPLPHPRREDSAREKEKAQPRPLGWWILRGYLAKDVICWANRTLTTIKGQ